MWGDWVGGLRDGIERAAGIELGGTLHALLGVDPDSGLVLPHGLLAATPMSRIRDRVLDLVVANGVEAGKAKRAVGQAWHAPDPVRLARPLADLPALLAELRRHVAHVGVATSDDRGPTERTLEALGVTDLVDAVACADDGHAVKPAPDAVLVLCELLAVGPERTLVVGDAPADMRMGRDAGAARTVGVLTGVGDRATLETLADVVLDSIADLVTESGQAP